MQTLKINEKICATCHYWVEDRSLKFANNKLYAINYQKPQGKCLVRNNILMNGQCQACPQYKRWNELP